MTWILSLVPPSEAGKELRGGAGLLREIMNWALGPAGMGAINLRGEGGRLLCWPSTCTAYSERSFNRLRDLCKAGCEGALVGLQRNCPATSPHFLRSILALSPCSLMKSLSLDGV